MVLNNKGCGVCEYCGCVHTRQMPALFSTDHDTGIKFLGKGLGMAHSHMTTTTHRPSSLIIMPDWSLVRLDMIETVQYYEYIRYYSTACVQLYYVSYIIYMNRHVQHVLYILYTCMYVSYVL